MTDIHRRASDVRAKHLLGYLGLVVEDDRNLERDFHNAGSYITHTISLSFSGASGSDTVSFTLGGRSDLADISYSFTTSAAATTDAAARQEIVDDFNGDAARTQFAWASLSGSSVVLSAVAPGADYAFTVTSVSGLSGSASTTKTGADPTAAPFGATIISGDQTSGSYLNLPSDWGRAGTRVGELKGTAISSAAANAAVTRIACTGTDNAKTVRVFVTLEGHTLWAEAESGSTAADTAQAIAAAVDQLSFCSAADDGDNVDITASKIGLSLDVEVVAVDTTTNTYTVSDATSGFRVTQAELVGIVAYKPTMYDTKTLGEAATGVPAGEEGIVLEEGLFLTKLGEATPEKPTHVYIGTSGSELNKLFVSNGAGRVAWLRCFTIAEARDGFTLCRLLPLSGWSHV